MKKMKQIIVAVFVAVSLIVVGCGTGNSNEKVSGTDSLSSSETTGDISTDMAKAISDIYAVENGDVMIKLVDGRTFSLGNMKGAKGDSGEDGKDGRDGKDGLNGENGADGLNGVDGINGLNGKDGADGSSSGSTVIIAGNGNNYAQNSFTEGMIIPVLNQMPFRQTFSDGTEILINNIVVRAYSGNIQSENIYGTPYDKIRSNSQYYLTAEVDATVVSGNMDFTQGKLRFNWNGYYVYTMEYNNSTAKYEIALAEIPSAFVMSGFISNGVTEIQTTASVELPTTLPATTESTRTYGATMAPTPQSANDSSTRVNNEPTSAASNE